MSNGERVEAIRKRAEAATAGPWVAEAGEVELDGRRPCEGIRAPLDADGYTNPIVITDSGYYPPEMNDALFIAHSREDIPWLLNELDGCRETLDSPERWMKWCDNRVLERCEALQARVERLEGAIKTVLSRVEGRPENGHPNSPAAILLAAIGDSK